MQHREEQHNIHELMQARWSPRSFSSELLTQEQIESLFQAARWAASSGNGQPWRFVYATSDQQKDFQRLVSLLDEGNAIWAKNAPFLMVVFSKTERDNGKLHPGHLYDTGLAMGQFCLQATAMGLQVHQMGGFAMDKANEALQVPSEYQPIAMAVVGHPAPFTLLPTQELQTREQTKSTRKPLQETVHMGTWKGGYQELT
ncbi:nitroreductase [Nibribacter ruber]|uniref:Nitroreductase n=1 Tax=Nibribacter ruber TaxID=2698458 RepID=A0A6P1NWI6_9BACT|nr:nitroreductase family protein [Nibribacter ruber]QHL88206.1 nitroreductase [Nibribacter ruber]